MPKVYSPLRGKFISKILNFNDFEVVKPTFVFSGYSWLVHVNANVFVAPCRDEP